MAHPFLPAGAVITAGMTQNFLAFRFQALIFLISRHQMPIWVTGDYRQRMN
ncbi:MAG: hypothetical protein ABIG63_07050 [Chloroflexota bacterium]